MRANDSVSQISRGTVSVVVRQGGTEGSVASSVPFSLPRPLAPLQQRQRQREEQDTQSSSPLPPQQQYPIEQQQQQQQQQQPYPVQPYPQQQQQQQYNQPPLLPYQRQQYPQPPPQPYSQPPYQQQQQQQYHQPYQQPPYQYQYPQQPYQQQQYPQQPYQQQQLQPYPFSPYPPPVPAPPPPLDALSTSCYISRQVTFGFILFFSVATMILSAEHLMADPVARVLQRIVYYDESSWAYKTYIRRVEMEPALTLLVLNTEVTSDLAVAMDPQRCTQTRPTVPGGDGVTAAMWLNIVVILLSIALKGITTFYLALMSAQKFGHMVGALGHCCTAVLQGRSAAPLRRGLALTCLCIVLVELVLTAISLGLVVPAIQRMHDAADYAQANLDYVLQTAYTDVASNASVWLLITNLVLLFIMLVLLAIPYCSGIMDKTPAATMGEAEDVVIVAGDQPQAPSVHSNEEGEEDWDEGEEGEEERESERERGSHVAPWLDDCEGFSPDGMVEDSSSGSHPLPDKKQNNTSSSTSGHPTWTTTTLTRDSHQDSAPSPPTSSSHRRLSTSRYARIKTSRRKVTQPNHSRSTSRVKVMIKKQKYGRVEQHDEEEEDYDSYNHGGDERQAEEEVKEEKEEEAVTYDERHNDNGREESTTAAAPETIITPRRKKH